MKLPEIVGVAGTNASGKDTLGTLRAIIQNAQFVSLSDILRHELDLRGLTHERENLRALGNEWRAESGPGVLVEKTIERYEAEKAEEGFTGLTITSIRHPKEAEAIKRAGGIIIWVDADRHIRYERIQKRNLDRPEDQKTFEQFADEEDIEMQYVEGDESSLNMGGVRDMADVTIINEYASLEDYEAYLTKEFELN
ncbi:MAG: hypothetical protein WAO28_03150 [Candidatus Microsaccharimonas sp.]